jgi:hypothetical protein
VRLEALYNERSVGGDAPASPNSASKWQAAGGLAAGATMTRKADASLKQSNDKFDSKMIKPLPRNCTIARIDTG